MVAAHRCVLAARSTVFKASLFDPIKERTSLTTTATIVQQVDDMDASAFKALLGFIYGDLLLVSADDDNEGVLLRQLLVVVHRYDLPRLREMCENKLGEVPSSDMQQNFTDLLQSREGTDVVFEVGGETFAAHRCILAARSTVFRALLLGPMKKEGTSTVVHVDDMDATAFEAMLGFICGESLPVPADHENEGVMLQHLLVAADRYDVPRLRLLCEKKLCENICVSTAMTILALAEQHGCNGLKKACYDFLRFRDNLREALATDGFDHLCRSCPTVMKDVILAMLQFS
ncbi:BTB/POZ and MATH domain-containing protein 2-like [Triticum aestivum]|uniref:BTB/POZ and MATH domain-containing protein 2-like n=1 Tax=Triticum aestivum TaxID=4565 RepID=UPI001D023071|nr:BTB/POZ and MATH domain-containing protein 2-like [Triticum aestivum]